VLEALDPVRYEVVSVAIGRDGRWALAAGADAPAAIGSSSAETLPVPAGAATLAALGAVDVVLPILHGPFGEDGTVQGLLELAGIPYVGAGVAASALAMDKDLFKKVMRASGIPVARHHAIRLGDPVDNPFGYPVFVKPARLGSSVGISKVHDEAELGPAVELARRHDEKVLVEEFVRGIEVECGVLGNLRPPPVASLPGRIDTLEHEWYDYESKYDEGGMELVIPPELPPETVQLVQQRAVDAFVASDCEGMARVDLFVREGDNEVIVNELNTIPGFTATSVYTRLFEASGIAYPELLDRLIELALERAERRAQLQY
jgi:D-alanine-D-alanine ligase